MSEIKKAVTATGIVSAVPVHYWGYTVTIVASAAITLYDNASAASGTVVDVIPATTAAGITKSFNSPVRCDNGLYASFAGTGTILFLYD